jgi:hypothetical protein
MANRKTLNIDMAIRAVAVAGTLAVLASSGAYSATGSVTYTYDALGRLRTARYDTGICIVYQYDANGNRTSQTVNVGGAPLTPTWGTGVWGCFNWTP